MNGCMQDVQPVLLPIRGGPQSVLAALARAYASLEAGQLAEAAKWAAIAAGLSETETLAKSA